MNDLEFKTYFRHAAYYAKCLQSLDHRYSNDDEAVIVDIDKKWTQIEIAIDWCIDNKDKSKAVLALCNDCSLIGPHVLALKCDVQKLISILEGSLEAAISLSDFKNEVILLYNLATTVTGIGQYEKAMFLFMRQINRSKGINDLDYEANGLFGLAQIYLLLGKHEDAIKNANKSRVLFKSLGDKKGEATVLTLIGNISVAAGTMDRAISSFKNATKLFGYNILKPPAR